MHVVVGAGPAGLTTAWELSRRSEPVVVLERDPEYVGGIARTVRYHGYRFDLGGHRFYTKHQSIEALWHVMLPDDFLTVPRLSRIYYEGTFFRDPIELADALPKLGVVRARRILASYAHARLRPRRPVVSFEDWVVNRFGSELFETFFRSYTEKVWGVPCDELSADFAAQRIRGLSLWEVIRSAVGHGRTDAKTLLTAFQYPRRGPGQLWERVGEIVCENGGSIELGCEVATIEHRDGVVLGVTATDGRVFPCDHLYSTMPLRELIAALVPPPPAPVLTAAAALRFRDFLTVAVIVDRAGLFPDNWIYIHSPDVRVGRIQNFGNWSEAMLADPATSCLGLEYFCQRDDELWSRSDEDLGQLAIAELATIGLVDPAECVDTSVVRVRDAYPVYGPDYRAARELVKTYLNQSFVNLHPAGRGGVHNYNSQDHSMMAGLVQARHVLDGSRGDVWKINTDQEYAETDLAGD